MAYLNISSSQIALHTNSSRIRTYWQHLFGDWLSTSARTIDAHLTLQLVDTLPALPLHKPYFVDQRTGILEAYRQPNGIILLHFFNGGYFEISADKRQITGHITTKIFDTGVIDDVTLVTLSPFLRSQGIYLLHAAGAVYQENAVLFIGQSHSGKTTTCLNLVLNGWQLLANDVILVELHDDSIMALPLPDMISLRPKTAELLPQIQSHLPTSRPTTEITIHAGRLVNNTWAAAAPISTLCFPTIVNQEDSHLQQQPQMVTLARLLEESLDSWDTDALASHTQLLSRLTRQATSYTLSLGKDVATFPAWLATHLEFAV